jgi:hypothetical protein
MMTNRDSPKVIRRKEKMEPEKSKDVEMFDALNPQAVDTQIGVRSLRTIKVYPLSMADQLRTTDLIAKAMEGFVVRGEEGDAAFVGYILELIKGNLAEILSMATDEDGGELLKEITNPQAVRIAEHIFDMNYGSIVKNVQSLVEKTKSLFPSARQSQQ